MAAETRLDPLWSIDTTAAQVAFWRLVDGNGWTELRRERWATDVTSLDHVRTSEGAPAISMRTDLLVGDGLLEACYPLADGAFYLSLEGGRVTAWVAHPATERCDVTIAELLKAFPRSEYEDGRVPVTFWTYSPHGPRAITRKIDVSPWDAIDSNYGRPAQGLLDEMMRSFRPSHGGQLVLWQGEPGTGKTHALRALAWEWRDWAELHYIVDPEQLFGDKADYLIDVLMYEAHSFAESEQRSRERWRVLVLEDCGEMLAADAKEKVGQALSRLLNVVDGMIGQGLKVLVLVTTNEELKKLHPAVSRPGRCAMQITFAELSGDDAHRWAVDHGVAAEDAPTDPHSLADLYALLEGFRSRPAERAVGFAAV